MAHLFAPKIFLFNLLFSGLFFLLMLWACRAGPPAHGAGDELSEQEIKSGRTLLSGMSFDEVAEEVAAVHDLHWKAPLRLRLLNDVDFNEAFVTYRRGLTGVKVYGSFGPDFSQIGDNPELYLGFYDVSMKHIYMRRRLPFWASGEEPRAILAHEMVHALQDQYMDIAPLYEGANFETKLSLRAFLEGDAQWTTFLLVAGWAKDRDRKGVNIDEFLAKDQMQMAGESIAHQELFAKASKAAQDELLFYYVYGAFFSANLYKSGGMKRINDAYFCPPRYSKEVFYPHLYLHCSEQKKKESRGDKKKETEAKWVSEKPPGFDELPRFSSALGEYGARTLLLGMKTKPSDWAPKVDSHLVWDHAVIFHHASRHTLLIWLTEWQTEESAEAAFELMKKKSASLVMRKKSLVLMLMPSLPSLISKTYQEQLEKKMEHFADSFF